MTYPFVYLDHGPLDPDSFGKVEAVWIAFQSSVPEAERRAIMASCPDAFAGFFRWGDTLFYTESLGDVYGAVVAEEHGDGGVDVSADAAMSFSKSVEAWIMDIHQRAPVAFFVGPSRSLEEGGWNGWSHARVGSVVVPWLEQYLDQHPDLPGEIEELSGAEDPEPGAEPIGVNPFTKEPMFAPRPRATPMDRATLAYLAQCFDVEELTAGEQERARVLAERLEWEPDEEDDEEDE